MQQHTSVSKFSHKLNTKNYKIISEGRRLKYMIHQNIRRKLDENMVME